MIGGGSEQHMNKDLFNTFQATLEKLRGQAYRVADETEAAAVIARILKESEAQCAATAQLSTDLQRLVEDQCARDSITLLSDPFDAETLPSAMDPVQVGIGGAAFAIAETATMVEVTTNDAHRLVSSMPRTYIGVAYERDMVPTLMEAAPRLRAAFQGSDENIAVSFISGPSRTGDIEMILTLGVHGPEIAHAIIISGETNA
jgi:L-lactate dehydrogenase complex protein LldG